METSDDDGTWIGGFPAGAAKQLRSMLATASGDVYDDATTALTPVRRGSMRQRIVTSFSDLPLVTRSELIRSLRTLDGGGR